jgi:hypothetical protein
MSFRICPAVTRSHRQTTSSSPIRWTVSSIAAETHGSWTWIPAIRFAI